jgi:L-alanine-DL-glutamate epimerase and related enzymes of enolase superfamily
VKIRTVDAIPVRLTRDLAAASGTAGSPSQLRPGDSGYRWSETVPALYSQYFETALVKIVLDDGRIGWGEAQAPLAPRVACTIVQELLRPVLLDTEFDGSVDAVAALWDRMYGTMRVRGHSGSFMLDAIAGVDLALWDLAGQIQHQPVSALISAVAKTHVPAYISGLPASSVEERVETARRYMDCGFRHYKLYYERDERSLFDLLDALRGSLGSSAELAVDALWRLDEASAVTFGRSLDERQALWLECPLWPEDVAAHARLAKEIRTPIALGESYRTCHELRPFFEAGVIRFVQPDLGRTGITEAIRISGLAASFGAAVVPHLSIALGPQVAAAIHFAAASANCSLLEYNPSVLQMANRFLSKPITIEGPAYAVPDAPGLCPPVLEESLRSENLFS